MDGNARLSAHDDYSFEQLSCAYNFRRTSDWPSLFVRLVVDDIEAAESPTTVVDIGCGNGIGGSIDRLRPVRAAADSLWESSPTAR